MRSSSWALVALTLLVPFPAFAAPSAQVVADDEWCREGHEDGRARHCEVREATLPATGLIAVDARPNGGIEVRGGASGEARLRVKIVATAVSEAQARDLAAQVRIETTGTVKAVGPDRSHDRNWYASFRLEVPRDARLRLEADNGGLHLSGLKGDVALHTVNGGIHVEGTNGHVHGETVNGGLHVALSGSEWQGEGLDLRSTNGGVHIEIPESYNAHLEAGTINGGVHSDLPVAQGHHAGGRILTDLGKGGRPIRVETSNGGLHIQRR